MVSLMFVHVHAWKHQALLSVDNQTLGVLTHQHNILRSSRTCDMLPQSTGWAIGGRCVAPPSPSLHVADVVRSAPHPMLGARVIR
eukprot:4897603-Pyramimonas_sp.AAC.1